MKTALLRLGLVGTPALSLLLCSHLGCSSESSGGSGDSIAGSANTGGASGNSGKLASGANSGGSSGNLGAVTADAGAGGQAGESGGSAGETEDTCAKPTASGCPSDLIEYDGQEADLADGCWKSAVPISCSLGASSVYVCWVDTETGKYYRLSASPCMPDAKWRACTDQEQALSLDAISADCR